MKDVIPINLIELIIIGIIFSSLALLVTILLIPDIIIINYLLVFFVLIFFCCFLMEFPHNSFYLFLIILFIAPVLLNFLPSHLGFFFRELPLFIIYFLVLASFCIQGTFRIKKCLFGFQEILLVILFFFMIGQTIRQYPLAVGILGFKGVMYYSPLYFITVYFFNTKDKIRKIIIFLVALGFVLALISILQHIFTQYVMSAMGYELGDVSYRTSMGHLKTSSTLANTSAFATIIATIFLIPLFLYLNNINIINRKSIFIILIVLGSSIILSFSRVTFLALGIVIFFSMFFYRKKMAKPVIYVLIVLFLYNLYLDNFLIDNFLSSFGIGENKLGIKSTFERIKIISQSLSLIAKKPLFGFGLGITGSPSLHFSDTLKNGYIVTDNYYLKLLIETGISGFFLFLLFNIYIIQNGIKSYFKISDLFLKNLSLALVMGIILYGLIGVATSAMELSSINCMFWIILGLLKSCKIVDSTLAINKT